MVSQILAREKQIFIQTVLTKLPCFEELSAIQVGAALH